jgi:hypothetical protein
MQINKILAELDSEIIRLQEAKSILTGTPYKHQAGSSKTPTKVKTLRAAVPAMKKHKISPEGRARIAAAQKKRWAKAKKGPK